MSMKHQIATAAVILMTATGGLVGAASAAPAAPAADAKAATTVGTIAISPSTNVKDKQKLTIKISKFGKYNGKVTVTQCTVGVISDRNSKTKYCDLRKSSQAVGTLKNGKGTITFTARAGKSFKTKNATQKCVKGGRCVITVTTGKVNPLYAGFAAVTFKR